MRIVVGVTGASGQIYARTIINMLRSLENTDIKSNPEVGTKDIKNLPMQSYASESHTSESHTSVNNSVEVDVVFTDTALKVYKDETGEQPPLPLIDNNSYYNRNASGSNCADVMIIIPCTMGTIGRIAAGATSDLISRIAEVQLKERKKLIICPRETPLSLIHLKNLTTLTEAGAIIAPASPSFYNHPGGLDELAANFAGRILQLAGIKPLDDKYRWG